MFYLSFLANLFIFKVLLYLPLIYFDNLKIQAYYKFGTYKRGGQATDGLPFKEVTKSK